MEKGPFTTLYVSRHSPRLEIADGVQFENGLCVTDNPNLQWLIEREPSFGKVMWKLDKLLLQEILAHSENSRKLHETA
jgi:hypothetical protein